MSQNEFIPHETFEAFVIRKTGGRMGKRMIFPEKNHQNDKRELLENYLMVMREKEKEKLDAKRNKIE